MTTYEDLLATVTGDPDDDNARLVFASHIREHDPDRAAFIEAQIAEAATRRARRDLLWDRKHPLLTKHEHEWSRIISKYAHAWRFDRGFVSTVEIDPFVFLEYGKWHFSKCANSDRALFCAGGWTLPDGRARGIGSAEAARRDRI